jgi:tape measure domain-containing protein
VATNSKRDVRLTVGIDVEGEDDLTRLGQSARGLGEAATSSTPALERMAREVDELAAATKKARDAEGTARTDSAAARRALDEQRDALARLRAETDRATKGTAEYEARERALRVAIVEGRTALREKQQAVTAAAAAARTAATAESELAAQFQRAGAAALLAGRQQATAARETIGTLEALQGQLATLRNIAGAALGGSLVGSLARDLAETADSAKGLRAALRLVVGEGPALETAYQGVFDIAQRTGAEVESTGTLFARIVRAGKEFNLTQADALALTESINQAVAVSGASAQASDAALTQLIQGLQSGVLRGEEFNSVMEQAPRLAQALADGLGVTTGELRNLAAQGALTADVVIKALQGQSATLQSEFDQIPLTVGRAITNLGTAWTLYVSQADAATGASKAAAEAIGALAANLDAVAGFLFGVGKAAAAYAALRLAQTFLANAAAAGTLAAATTAATAATVANTTAQTANAAATAGTVASAGRLAGVLGTLKTLSFLGVVTNLQSIGTAIGEGAAKLLGYGKALDEAEEALQAEEAATRRNAAAKAELAQRTEQATDKALGLDKQSKALIATFEGLALKGSSTAEALAKVGKELDLSDVRGITTAGAALDALAQRGRITADQLRDTLGAALQGEDLARFEAQARAAFDGSEQGVRRLQAALDALADESLRRAGTSARELGTGFSEAATSAINDVDALARTLAEINAPADEAGRALAAGLGKALAAANTERAVRAVIARLTDLGSAGRIAGERVATGLQAAQTKLDELRPGVNSLAEALRTLGLKTREELQATADKLGEAYARVTASGQVSLQDQAKAFNTWREAALAASGGVESGQLKLQRVMLQSRIAALGLGDTIEGAMRRAKTATDEAATAQQRYNALLQSDPSRLVGGTGLAGIGNSSANTPDGLPEIDSFGKLIRSTPSGGITRTASGQLQPPDTSGDWFFNTARRGEGPYGLGVWELTPEAAARRQGEFLAATSSPVPAPVASTRGPTPTPAPRPTPAPVPISVTIGRNVYDVRAADRASAEALIKALEDAYAAGGGS